MGFKSWVKALEFGFEVSLAILRHHFEVSNLLNQTVAEFGHGQVFGSLGLLKVKVSRQFVVGPL